MRTSIQSPVKACRNENTEPLRYFLLFDYFFLQSFCALAATFLSNTAVEVTIILFRFVRQCSLSWCLEIQTLQGTIFRPSSEHVQAMLRAQFLSWLTSIRPLEEPLQTILALLCLRFPAPEDVLSKFSGLFRLID